MRDGAESAYMLAPLAHVDNAWAIANVVNDSALLLESYVRKLLESCLTEMQILRHILISSN